MTTITMPAGVIEGFETMVLISLSIGFPQYLDLIHIIFGSGVVITIIYRIWWASNAIR